MTGLHLGLCTSPSCPVTEASLQPLTLHISQVDLNVNAQTGRSIWQTGRSMLAAWQRETRTPGSMHLNSVDHRPVTWLIASEAVVNNGSVGTNCGPAMVRIRVAVRAAVAKAARGVSRHASCERRGGTSLSGRAYMVRKFVP